MPSNARNLANLLGAGETTISAEKLGSDVAPGTEDYSSIDSLGAGTIVGETAFVEGSNRLYIWNGSGWYNIALINTTPTWDSGGQPVSSYVLDGDSPQDATVITLAASDPEGLPISYNYITSGQMDSIATISQDSSVFTITPKTSVQVPDGGTGSITFRATDGVNILPQISSFTLNFITTIQNSKYTTLLATATGTSDNNNIADSSTNNHTITVNGDAHAGTFSPYRSGGYSVHLDDGEEISFPDSSNYNLSNVSFSVEAWVYPTSYDSPWSGVVSQFSSSSRGWGLAFSSTQITFLGSTNGGSSTNVNGSVTSSVPLNQWTHLLVTRDSNTIRIFNNGVLVNNFTESGTFNNSTNPLRIGELNSDSSENFRGYIRDARVVKGSIPTEEYQTSSTTNGTTIFTAPNEPLTAVTDTVLLTCHLPYISDGSTNDATPTLSGSLTTKPFSPYDYTEYSAADHGGSVYFDGSSGDYLAMPVNGDFQFGTGDFTIEMWAKVLATSSDSGRRRIFIQKNGQSASSIFQIIINTDGTIQAYNAADILASTTSFANGSWGHIAFVRDNGTLKVYINGKLENSVSNTTNFSPSSPNPVIGIYPFGGVAKFHGYISDFKITKSVEYTSDFTPPTAPISSSNAILHIKGTDASIIDKSQVNNLKLIGGPTGSTTQAKFSNTKSIDFGDGSLTYVMEVPSGAGYTGQFTIEFWMYNTYVTSTWQALVSNSYVNGSEYFRLYKNNGSGSFALYHNSTSAKLTGIGTIANNTWTHVAVVRDSSNNITVYQDGTSIGSYNNNQMFGTASNPINVGKGGVGDTTNYPMSGYIQDFRITKGLARYTANFTPPTEPLEG